MLGRESCSKVNKFFLLSGYRAFSYRGSIVMSVLKSIFEDTCSTENLFQAWFNFRRGKMKRRDVLAFDYQAEKNIFLLQRQLVSDSYRHAPYTTQHVCGPKPRIIRRACVVDRIVHQAVSMQLDALFDKQFIQHVYSGRKGRGIHAGVGAVEQMTRKVSKNYKRPCYYLKADISKFYDSVDHEILLAQLARHIADDRMMKLLCMIVESFHVPGKEGKGIPIGNVPSQLFTNIYLNSFDHWLKESVRVKHYARFCDDFVLIADNPQYLEQMRYLIGAYLADIQLVLHPHKVSIAPLKHGLDFLGYVLLPHYRRVRSKTVRRMFGRLALRERQRERGVIDEGRYRSCLQSYRGILSHANTHKLLVLLDNRFSIA